MDDVKKLLWLDDKRNPYLNDEGLVPSGYVVDWVRDYKEFTQYLSKYSMPDAISFDHDLEKSHYTPEYFWNNYEESKKYQEWNKTRYKEPTGEGCAEWLVDLCSLSDSELPKIYIHSANPVGADWISDVINDYKSNIKR